MSTTKTTPRICEAKNQLEEFRLSVRLQAPALAEVLDQLDAGKNPNPLDVMAAISQGVAYLTAGPPGLEDPPPCVEAAAGRVCWSC